MAIADQITRLSNAANIIKNKTEKLGLKKNDGTLVTKEDTLEKQAEAINNILTMSAPTVELLNEEQTIDCVGKIMSSNVVIPAANVYYTGDDIPSDGLGKNGDFYLVTGVDITYPE